jgi:hypothetical protein
MNRSLRPALVVIATAATLAFAAGCGNSEENDYVAQLNEQNAALQSAVTGAASGVQTGDVKGTLDAIDAAQQEVADIADAIEGIDPPSEVADLHQQLIDTTRSVADGFAAYREALGSGSAQKIKQGAQQFKSDVTAELEQQSQIVDDINAEFGN